MRLFIVMLFLSILLDSCDNRQEIKIQKYPNGVIESEVSYVKNMKNGLAKYYYPNGSIKDERYFIGGKREGLSKHYSNKGNLEGELEFVNGLQEGWALWYYPNGIVKSKSYWLAGKQYGSAYFYHENGELERYQCIDKSETAFNIIKWNDDGYLTSEDGVLISSRFTVEGTDSLGRISTNKQLLVNIPVATPPKMDTDYYLQERSQYGNIFDSLTVINNTIFFKKIFNKTGNYEIVFIGYLKNLNGDTLAIDSLFADFTVN